MVDVLSWIGTGVLVVLVLVGGYLLFSSVMDDIFSPWEK